VDVVRELADHAPNHAVLIDTLARALKERGFSRPPGSPRLITRLRRIRELVVSRTGMITLADAATPPGPDDVLDDSEPAVDVVVDAEDVTEVDDVDGNVAPVEAGVAAGAGTGGPRRGRRRRRRGRRGGRGGGGGAAAAPPA
jgi:hypothetical protein